MLQARTEVPAKDRWNIEALYASTQDWKNDLAIARGEEASPHWPKLQNFAGKLNDPEALAQFFNAYFEIDRKLSKLYTYAQMRLDVDLSSDESKENVGLISSLVHDFQVEFAWVEPEILSLSVDDFSTLTENPALEEYRFYLEKLQRMRPHVLSRELEELFALSGKALEAPGKAFGALENADLTFEPAETSKKEKKELSNGSYQLYMQSPDRQLRKSAFINLHKGFEKHANTFCELLQGQVQIDLYAAKAKKFPDSLHAALFPDRIDPAVYDNLIDVIHENLGLLHKYIHLRKERLGLKDLHPYDLYVPLVEEMKMKADFPSACKMVIDAVAPLGKSYQSDLEKGYKDGWVDPYENQGKRSGAYSGGCYDSMPYILMNFYGSLRDCLTLAHESGHSMHSFLSRKSQPYIYANYSLFVAEVASTFNEQLLLDNLKEKARSKKDLAYLVNYQLEGIRTTIFRQAMFAEFERQIHRWAEEGKALTPQLLKDEWLRLNRLYYGDELVLDGGIEFECFRIPHFYYNFYVYQYATSLSAALALHEEVSRSSVARDRYLKLLSSGGSNYPIDLLKTAGVDLSAKAPIEAAMQRFSKLLIEFSDCMK